jgi:UrcA family protein
MIRTMFFATAAILASSSIASAAGKAVDFDRAKLGDPAYIEALYAEIELAAVEVCKAELRGSPFYHSKVRNCVKVSMARAVAEIDAPMLTALADGAPEYDLADAR